MSSIETSCMRARSSERWAWWVAGAGVEEAETSVGLVEEPEAGIWGWQERETEPSTSRHEERKISALGEGDRTADQSDASGGGEVGSAEEATERARFREADAGADSVSPEVLAGENMAGLRKGREL